MLKITLFHMVVVSLAEDACYILIVDDLPEICEVLAEFFTAEGYLTKTALCCADAVRHIRASKPSLILLDINMSGKDGLEILEEVKDLISGVPVIVITAYGELAKVIDARQRGLIDIFIPKPFDIFMLKRLVRQITGEGEDEDCGAVTMCHAFKDF